MTVRKLCRQAKFRPVRCGKWNKLKRKYPSYPKYLWGLCTLCYSWTILEIQRHSEMLTATQELFHNSLTIFTTSEVWLSVCCLVFSIIFQVKLLQMFWVWLVRFFFCVTQFFIVTPSAFSHTLSTLSCF